MGSNGGTAKERVESAPRERVRGESGCSGCRHGEPQAFVPFRGCAGLQCGSGAGASQGREAVEQKYDLELSFPVDSVLATNVNDDRRARIDNLIQEILLATQDEQVNSLPGTLLDPSSIIFEEDYRCEDGG